MYITDIILEKTADIDFKKFWGHANALGKKVTVRGPRNDYTGFIWKNYFFYKAGDNVKAVPVNTIKSKIV